MAGAGYKLFVNGNALSASDLNTYVQQQTVMVFASASARTTALSGVLAEGMVSYRTDSHVFEVYNGTSWVSAGASSPLTTKGDLWGYNTADARVPVGTDGQLLKADSTNALGVSWTTVSGGGMTLISETVASSLTSLSLSSIPQTYKQLMLVWDGVYSNTSNTGFGIRLNASTSLYENRIIYVTSGGAISTSGSGSSSIGTTLFGYNVDGSVWSPGSVTTTHGASGFLVIDNYASTTKMKPYWTLAGYESAYNGVQMVQGSGFWASTSAVISIDVFRDTGSGTFSNTTDNSIRLYGIN